MNKIKLILLAILTGGLAIFAYKVTAFVKTKMKFFKK
jgi:hypothetical protein